MILYYIWYKNIIERKLLLQPVTIHQQQSIRVPNYIKLVFRKQRVFFTWWKLWLQGSQNPIRPSLGVNKSSLIEVQTSRITCMDCHVTPQPLSLFPFFKSCIYCNIEFSSLTNSVLKKFRSTYYILIKHNFSKTQWRNLIRVVLVLSDAIKGMNFWFIILKPLSVWLKSRLYLKISLTILTW